MVSTSESLYYFYYFFEKSRATVAHFFSTVISLFSPTASTFFGRVVQGPGAQTTRPHHENFLHSFSFSPLQCFKHKKRRVPNAFFCMKIYFHYCNISLLRNWSFPHEYFNMYFFEFLLWYCYDKYYAICYDITMIRLSQSLSQFFRSKPLIYIVFFIFQKTKKILDYYTFFTTISYHCICSALNAKKDVVIWERVLRLFFAFSIV